MTWLNPQTLWLLCLIPLLIAWYAYRGKKEHGAMNIPLSINRGIAARSWRVRLRHLPFLLRLTSIACVIVALARPQSTNSWSKSDVEGIDIMLTMDISTSMLAMDFKPNRIEGAKIVAKEFVSMRPNDNIGLVAFAGESFTACPLTSDHAILLNRLEDIEPGIIQDKTAIGLGLATALNRLRNSQAQSKVVILLTDGVNNAGDISPQIAGQLARTLGITIHTIGMGTDAGMAPYPITSAFGGTVIRPVPVELDEAILKQVANDTGGEYFRATDLENLKGIYKEIDNLEKTKLKTRNYHITQEQYQAPLLLAFISLLFAFVLRNTYLRTSP
ncbi:MAG: VWA domain-containing protein [Porphyromonadaceae bacterium]|nr:VWA domain-containing protein [Porphyromonadaceae bacterium]